jgi:hypothetical protein
MNQFWPIILFLHMHAHALIPLDLSPHQNVGCFLATNLPETHILWPSERIFIFDLLIRASEKQTYSLYSPVLVDFPLGRSNITLNKPRQGTHDIEKNASCGVFCRTIRKGEGICERHLARLGGFPSWSDCQRVHG